MTHTLGEGVQPHVRYMVRPHDPTKLMPSMYIHILPFVALLATEGTSRERASSPKSLKFQSGGVGAIRTPLEHHNIRTGTNTYSRNHSTCAKSTPQCLRQEHFNNFAAKLL